MADLSDRITSILGDGYVIERELGGGGMSRVFLATETALGRKVVIKVLPPEMSAGVNRERFEREIKLAAQLQHPHIVPLLTAGNTTSGDHSSDLLFYIMPYIEGESLRVKLEREGELPVSDTVKILREVIDALAYAHEAEVVHRDIKPDNVMLTRGHAVVTDFGVAKAVSASSGGTVSSLTSMGVALGTPAYMSPEQAAADPHVDHRADIYAVGVLAYEMLTGRPPFVKQTPQQVLAAQVSEEPVPVSALRNAVTAPLGEVIMRCLTKRAADRWQTANELKAQLNAVTTPESGGITPTATGPAAAVPADGGLRVLIDSPVKVAALFGGVAAFVAVFAYAAMIAFGLPNWFFLATLSLLIVGFPIVVLTGHKEKQRADARTTGLHTPTPVGLERHMTWRKSLLGGVSAFVGLAVVAAAFMAMRSTGIGPGATLVSRGVLGAREPIIVAEFTDRTGDSTLGLAVTEAMRIDLGQSPVVALRSNDAILGTLERMGRPPNTRIDYEVAREIAVRDGVKAIVAGEVNAVGNSYVISARLVTAEDGVEHVALRETASSESDVIPAIDNISARLRERMGESLKTIRATEPLSQVSTASLEALRWYSQGRRIFDQGGDMDQSTRLLQRAVEVDSTFASAWRAIAVNLGNAAAPQAQVQDALTRAFRFRNNLPVVERYGLEAYYYMNAEIDLQRAIEAYEVVLALDSNENTALNNLSIIHTQLRNFDQALHYARRAADTQEHPTHYINLIGAFASLGDQRAVDSVDAIFAAKFPNSALYDLVHWFGVASQRLFDSATVGLQAALQRHSSSYSMSHFFLYTLEKLTETTGRIRESDRLALEALRRAAEGGNSYDYLTTAAERALKAARYTNDPDRGVEMLDTALARYPLDSLDPLDRPYAIIAEVYAAAGRVSAAQALLDEFERETPLDRRNHYNRHLGVAAQLAMREQRWVDAIDLLQRQAERPAVMLNLEQGPCNPCGLFELAQAYDGAGRLDSAIAVYERAIATPGFGRFYSDSRGLATAYRRLGELYENRGDRDRAVQRYGDFVDLWRDADPELQPVVNDVRRRIARLSREGAN